MGSGSFTHLSFTSATYHAEIQEHELKGTVLTTVGLTINGGITYNFVAGNTNNIFSINNNGMFDFGKNIFEFTKINLKSVFADGFANYNFQFVTMTNHLSFLKKLYFFD